MRPSRDVVRRRQLNIDVLCAMMEYEITHSCRDYLSNDDCNIMGRAMFSAESKLTAEDREQIVDWCYGVVDVLQLARSNVAVINEQVIFSVEQCAEATHGMYTVEDIEAMERAILDCLSWKVSAPSALEVGNIALELATPQVQDVSEPSIELMGSIVEDLAFQTESAVRDYHLATQRPSTIAIMALLNAIKYNGKMSKTVRQHYLNALLNVLEQCKTRIEV